MPAGSSQPTGVIVLVALWCLWQGGHLAKPTHKRSMLVLLAWSQVDMLRPGLVGTYWQFGERFGDFCSSPLLIHTSCAEQHCRPCATRIMMNRQSRRNAACASDTHDSTQSKHICMQCHASSHLSVAPPCPTTTSNC